MQIIFDAMCSEICRVMCEQAKNRMLVIGNVIKLISSVTPRGYESQAYRVDIEENDCKIIALHIVALYDDSPSLPYSTNTRARTPAIPAR